MRSAEILDFYELSKARAAHRRAVRRRKAAEWITNNWGLSLFIGVVVVNAAIYAGFYYGMCWAAGVNP